MGNRSPAWVMVAVLLIAAAAPLGHGRGLPFDALSVTGKLCCTPSGNCPDGPPLAGVTVNLICTKTPSGAGDVMKVDTAVAKATTGGDGSFKINIPEGLNVKSPLVRGLELPCFAVVKLPISGGECPALKSANGVLAGNLMSGKVARVPEVGTVGNMGMVSFVNLKPEK